MKNPLISIIIPVYNVEKYLRECLDSVLAQTYGNYEVLLIDDCSPDGSAAICHEYEARDSRFRYLKTPHNMGAGLARNVGVKEAKGSYVAFLDSDDTLRHDFLEYCVDKIQKHGLDVVRGTRSRFTVPGNYCPAYVVPINEFKIFEGEELRKIRVNVFGSPMDLSQPNYHFGCSVCVALFKKEIVEALEFLSEREMLSEDQIWLYNLYGKLNRIGMSPELLGNYRENPVSLSRSADFGYAEKLERFYLYNKEMLERDGFGREGILHLYSCCTRMFRGASKFLFMNPTVTAKQRSEWLDKVRNTRALSDLLAELDEVVMPAKHKLGLKLLRDRRYRLLYLLTTGQERLRQIKKKLKGDI